MVQSNPIKNWMREEFAEGKKDGIPVHLLEVLEAEAKAQKPAPSKSSGAAQKAQEATEKGDGK